MSNPYPDYSKGVLTTPNYNVPFAIPKNQIEFRDENVTDSWVMRITADRRIEVNEDVEVTEAAKKVLEAMQHLLAQQRTWVGLMDEERKAVLYKSDTAEEVAIGIEAKLKEKNDKN